MFAGLDAGLSALPVDLTGLTERGISACALVTLQRGWRNPVALRDAVLLITLDAALERQDGYPLAPGRICCLQPDHQSGLSCTTSGRALCLRLRAESPYQETHGRCHMLRARRERIEDLARLLIWECRQGRQLHSRAIAQAAANLLALLLDRNRDEERRRDPWHRRLALLWEAVAAKPEQHWTLPELAQLVGISPPQLHRRVVEQDGISPMRVVRRIRLEQAASQLRTSEATMDVIAAAVGWQCPFAFSKAFKRHFGECPRHYRKRFARARANKPD